MEVNFVLKGIIKGNGNSAFDKDIMIYDTIPPYLQMQVDMTAETISKMNIILKKVLNRFYTSVYNDIVEYGCVFHMKDNSSILEIITASKQKIAEFNLVNCSCLTEDDKSYLDNLLKNVFKQLLQTNAADISEWENRVKMRLVDTVYSLCMVSAYVLGATAIAFLVFWLIHN